MRQGFFDKFVSKLDRIDSPVLSAHITQLARERGFLESLFQSIDEGLLVIGSNQTLLYANHGAEQILGLNAEDMRGKSISRYLREWNIDSLLRAQVSDWSRIETRDVEVDYPEHRYISFYARPIEFEGATELLLILRDVTSRHHAEESALVDERLDAVKTLAAGVAHEIGNPLNALTIHLQLMKRELRGLADPDVKASLNELTDIAEHEVTRLDGIIRRFLTALRPVKPNLMRGNVIEVLQTTLKVLAPDIEQRQIMLKTIVPAKVPDIFMDAGQLEQVFFNLIKNAMDAIPDNGRIGITVTVDDVNVNISFLDNGTGISPELLGHIFDPYVTTKAKGNGLGLMIVKRIIQAHSGSIEAASRANEGTCFTLHLPRAERTIRTLPQATEDA